jgi:MFS family permease
MTPEPAKPNAARGPRSLVRALAHRNFRLFFAGQGVSLIGTWMQQTAMIWLVYQLTKSPFLLGLVGFAGQVPGFFLAPFSGVVSDRFHRQRLIVLTQSLAMVQALLLALLSFTGTIEVWHIVVLSVALGVVNTFDMTARQAFMTEMVEKRDLPNAIALNSSMVNGARLIGPSVAGFLVAALGVPACFLLNGLSYVAVIAALLSMRIIPRQRKGPPRHVLHEMKEGFTYAFGFGPIRSLILLLALVSFMGMPYAVLMPVFAKDILHGGPETLGFLMAASGVGALAGGIYLAGRKSVLGLGIRIALAPGLFGAGLIGFALSQQLWLSLPLLALVGFAFMVQMASSNTVLQTIVEEDKRGRVMSFYTMAFIGMAPWGSLLAGALADRIGAPRTLVVGGLACIAGSLLFARGLPRLRALTRPIYIKMGILPEVATGIQAASEMAVPPED